MIQCLSIEEARQVPGVVHIEAGSPVIAYVAGDALPAYLTTAVTGVPQEVTMRQARLALLGSGNLAAVDSAINAMPEPQRSAARIEWEYSGTVQRNKPLVLSLGPALGLTTTDLDALFIAAANIA